MLIIYSIVFLQFNVNEGQRIDFVNPAGVDNIFSRVTGDTPSEIMGTLGVLGDCSSLSDESSWYFVRDQMQRWISQDSFTATTAGGIEFANSVEFSAIAPEIPPLLEVNVSAPVGFAL